MAHILLIEDETNLRESIELNLKLENYRVTALDRGSEIIALLEKQHFDLIILDIMLPQINGLDICQIIRNHHYHTPILLLSAKSDSQDRAAGLKVGADDYMVKPFELDELLFRIKKLLQGATSNALPSHTAPKEYTFAGANIFYPASLEVQIFSGKRVILSKKESLLLTLLLENKNTPVPRNKMMHFIWGFSVYSNTRTIDNFILKFRKLFETNPHKPKHFLSKRSIGYMYQE